MSVTMVVGRAGSGKTRRCLDAIVAALRAQPLGSPIYWILPKQGTFNAERQLTCQSGLGAFCRARVVSFEQFGNDIFEDCGASAIPQVTPLGRQMIIGHLLRQNRSLLRFYSHVARQPGLAGELDAMFAELERSGKSPAELAAVIDELAQTNAADLELAPLLDKLRDAKLLYDAYLNYLGQDRLDQHQRLTQVEKSLTSCSFLGKSTIYVDGFTEFTDYERRILVGAANAGAKIEITLMLDPASPLLANPHLNPDEMGLFCKTEETYRKLYFAFEQAGVPQAEPVRLHTVSGFHTPALKVLESSLFRDPIRTTEEWKGIELIEASDRRTEVEAAARGIRSLLMDGHRFRDIGVLVRDLDQYHELVGTIFPEHAIPYFADRRRTATHHPLMEFVRSLFQIARNDWPHDAVMSLLRTGLGGISLFDADGLENYVLAHRIHGGEGWESAKPWNYRRRTIGAEDIDPFMPGEPQEAEKLRRQIVDRISPLLRVLQSEEPVSVRAVATEIFNTLDRFNVRKTLAKWISEAEQRQDLEQSAEHEQVWVNVSDLFEQMVDLLGDEKMAPGEFYNVLESGLESFDLALAPPTVDQVLVGQVDRTRTHTFRAAFVLGLNEGEFPRAGSGGSILNDRDRRTLRRRRVDLSPDLHQRLLDERRMAYLAFTRASERLYVSRPLSDDEGRPAKPSTFWLRMESLFPNVARRTVPASSGTGVPPVLTTPQSEDRQHRRDRHATGQHVSISTPRQLVTSLMHWVRSNSDPVKEATDPPWPAMYQWLATRPDVNDAIGMATRLAWPALSYTNEASLSPAVANELFHSPLRAGVSQLETFAACPFRHFARFVLGLKAREEQEVTIQDLGRLYHDLLEKALKEVLRRRAEGDRGAKLEQAIDGLIEQIGSALREELMLSSARNRYLLERTRRTTQQIAAAQREMLKRGRFRPSHVGIRFGQDGNMPPLHLKTSGGREVLLEGKIDRIDRVDASNDVTVIDYRLGPGRLPMGMVLHGLSLQLLSYLLVLEADGQRLTGRDLQPAAAFYLQLIRKIEDVKHPDEGGDPSDPKWHLKLKPRGLFDRRCLSTLDRELTTGQSEVVQAFVKQDGSLGRRQYSDAVESEEFAAILKVAAARLGELADGILSGRIDIAPYRLKDKSPCPRCDYRSVCRFDPAINKYNHLVSLSMEDVLSRYAGEADHG